MTTRAQAPTMAFDSYRLDTWQPGASAGTLPANNINFLAQSGDGYLWLATSAGLTRFDGVRFDLTTSRVTPAFDHRLAYIIWPMQVASRDSSVKLASHDTLWIATDRGMIAYAHGVFYAAAPDTTLEGEAVQQLTRDGAGTVYGVTVRGSVFRIDRGRYTRIPLPDVPGSDGFGIVADSDGTLWIAHDRAGLVRLHGGIATRYGARDGLGDERATCVFRSSDGALWIGTRSGVARMTGGKFTRINFWGGPSQHAVFAAAETSDGALWFATDGGGVVRLVPRADGSFASTTFTRRDGLTDDRAISILADEEGNVWVGTRLGLNRFHPVPFQALTVRTGLPASAMGAILLDSLGQLWLAPVEGGLYRGRFVQGRVTLREVASQERGRVTTLARGRGGSVWAGWEVGGATNYEPDGTRQSIGASQGVAPGTVFAIVDAPGGDLWIGSRGGVSRFSTMGRRTRVRNFTTRDGLQENVGMRLWTHKATDMWVGNAALSHIVGDSVRTFRVADGLAAPLVTAIHADTDGTIWVATHGGLTRVRNGRLVPLHGAQGLLDEYLDAIEDDGRGHLWLAGAQGLTRLSRTDLDSVAEAIAGGRDARLTSAVTFGAADGLPGQDAVLDASPGSIHAPDGKLWFAMAWGIAIVDPLRLPRDTPQPHVHIESIIVDGQSIRMDQLIELAAGTRRVEIRYTGINLSDGAGVHLRYRLDGLDTNWVDAGTERVASFTHLPPGNYRLHVSARSARGAWSAKEATLRFQLLPELYQRWWFILSCLALVVFVAWAILRYRRMQLEARAHAVIEERTRVARELHDTLLQGFTGIALQLRAIGLQRRRALPPTGNANERARDDHSTAAIDALVGVAESTLREARHAVWDLRVRSSVDFSRNTPSIVEYLERAARDTIGDAPIAFDLTTAGDRRTLPEGVEQEICRIAREAMANAVRHGMPSRIVSSLIYETDFVRLMVRDDGCGFDVGTKPTNSASSVRSSFGLIGMRERAARIHATLTITSTPGHGSEVLVTLPTK